MKLKCYATSHFSDSNSSVWVGVLSVFLSNKSHFKNHTFKCLFLRVFCITQMGHGRLVSRPNYPENLHMCLLLVPIRGKQNALNRLFKVPRVDSHIWSFSCIPLQISQLILTHRLEPMCSSSSVVEKQREENARKNSTLPWSGARLPLPVLHPWSLLSPSPLHPPTRTQPT